VLSGITPENTVFLLDDGFQHRKLHRDLDLVCVDKAVLNDRLIPCGYLREPLESLNRADAVFLIDYSGSVQECYKIKAELSKRFPDLPCFILCQEADCWVNFNTGQRIRTPPLPNPVAFCGIARPNRFFDLLRSLEVRPCKELKFSDHHIYNEPDFKSIHELYSQGMVTTEKDAFRLKNSGVVIPSEFWYLKIKLRFTDSDSQSVFNRLITGLISNT
jgi:tetraacyldisaccharide 4'-kinase